MEHNPLDDLNPEHVEDLLKTAGPYVTIASTFLRWLVPAMIRQWQRTKQTALPPITGDLNARLTLSMQAEGIVTGGASGHGTSSGSVVATVTGPPPLGLWRVALPERVWYRLATVKRKRSTA